MAPLEGLREKQPQGQVGVAGGKLLSLVDLRPGPSFAETALAPGEEERNSQVKYLYVFKTTLPS